MNEQKECPDCMFYQRCIAVAVIVIVIMTVLLMSTTFYFVAHVFETQAQISELEEYIEQRRERPAPEIPAHVYVSYQALEDS